MLYVTAASVADSRRVKGQRTKRFDEREDEEDRMLRPSQSPSPTAVGDFGRVNHRRNTK